MGLKVINFLNHQIETIRFGNNVIGFKVHARAFFGNDLAWKNCEVLGEFEYLTDAAKFVAERSSQNDKNKEDLIRFFLCHIYAEGEDFR